MTRNVHWNYHHCELRLIVICRNRRNNRDFRGILLNRGGSQMNKYRWFCDFEKDDNRIRNVINADKAQEEIWEIERLFRLPKYINFTATPLLSIEQTCRPCSAPASYKLSPVRISFLQKSRKLSVTKWISPMILSTISIQSLLFRLLRTCNGTS